MVLMEIKFQMLCNRNRTARVKDKAYWIISIVSKMMWEPFWKTGSFPLGFFLKNEASIFFPVIGLT